MSKNSKPSAIVYSSEHGRMCPNCGKPIAQCFCRREKKDPVGNGVVKIRREIKGRKGKCVTVIEGVPLGPDAIKKLGQQLKKLCATGGAVKDGVIEIQGDHRDNLVEELKKQGWTVKCSGR